MSALLMVLLSSVLVTTVVLAHMPQWRPFVAPTDIFGGARLIAIACLVAVPAVALIGWLVAQGFQAIGAGDGALTNQYLYDGYSEGWPANGPAGIGGD